MTWLVFMVGIILGMGVGICLAAYWVKDDLMPDIDDVIEEWEAEYHGKEEGTTKDSV